VAASGSAVACELPPGVRVESERLRISYWTIPAKIAVGQPFVLELAACPKKDGIVSGGSGWTRTCRNIAMA
jgi:hypothetical protein